MSTATVASPAAPVLSPAAAGRLEQELGALVEERSVRATEPIEASGDAADLAEFAARDMLLERLDERIADLRGLLAEASVSAPRADKDGAGSGSLVDLRFGTGRTVETFLVGHLAEADGVREVITPDSPLGRALRGAKAGSTVRYGAPAGDVDVTVVDVRAA